MQAVMSSYKEKVDHVKASSLGGVGARGSRSPHAQGLEDLAPPQGPALPSMPRIWNEAM